MHWLVDVVTQNPKLQAALVAVGSIAAAYLIEWIVRRTLVVLTRRTHTELDDRVLQALRRPVFVSLILLGLSWTTDLLDLAGRPRFITLAALKTIAILVWTLAAFHLGQAVLQTLSRRSAKGSLLQPRTLPVFDMTVKITAVALAIYFAFLAWHIDVTGWLASAGIVGIALGFAAKDSLANLISGIFILADAPYKVGDFIVLDDGLRGQVTQIGMRSTRILTRDDIEITIPNAVIGNSKIVNEAGGPYVWQRLRVPVAIAYGSDVDYVREVLITCKDGVDNICANPEPQVRFREFGDSGLIFELLVWIDDPALRGRVLDQLHMRVYKGLQKAGIEIPYNKHDVYIKEMPPGTAGAAGTKGKGAKS